MRFGFAVGVCVADADDAGRFKLGDDAAVTA